MSNRLCFGTMQCNVAACRLQGDVVGVYVSAALNGDRSGAFFRLAILIFLLVAGLLLAGSESESFLGNIIGIAMLFIAGNKLTEQDNTAT